MREYYQYRPVSKDMFICLLTILSAPGKYLTSRNRRVHLDNTYRPHQDKIRIVIETIQENIRILIDKLRIFIETIKEARPSSKAKKILLKGGSHLRVFILQKCFRKTFLGSCEVVSNTKQSYQTVKVWTEISVHWPTCVWTMIFLSTGRLVFEQWSVAHTHTNTHTYTHCHTNRFVILALSSDDHRLTFDWGLCLHDWDLHGCHLRWLWDWPWKWTLVKLYQGLWGSILHTWDLIGNSDSKTMKVRGTVCTATSTRRVSHSARLRSGCKKQSLSLDGPRYPVLKWLTLKVVHLSCSAFACEHNWWSWNSVWISICPVCSRGTLRWRLKSLCQTTKTDPPTVSLTFSDTQYTFHDEESGFLLFRRSYFDWVSVGEKNLKKHIFKKKLHYWKCTMHSLACHLQHACRPRAHQFLHLWWRIFCPILPLSHRHCVECFLFCTSKKHFLKNKGFEFSHTNKIRRLVPRGGG